MDSVVVIGGVMDSVVGIGGVMDSVGGIVSVVVDADVMDWLVASGIKHVYIKKNISVKIQKRLNASKCSPAQYAPQPFGLTTHKHRLLILA